MTNDNYHSIYMRIGLGLSKRALKELRQELVAYKARHPDDFDPDSLLEMLANNENAEGGITGEQQ